MLFAKKNEYRLAVGNLVIGMSFYPSRYAAVFKEYFGAECSQEKPDIHLELRITQGEKATGIESSLFTSKSLTKTGFVMLDGLVRGMYDKKTKEGRIRISKILTIKPAIRVFEQLLYQAYYSAKKNYDCDEFLVHSAGVLHRGLGYLFVGSTGAGKTTVARLSHPDSVLNDEINLISFVKNEVEVQSTPFNGLFKEKSAGYGKLKAVLLLRQASEHKLKDIKGVDAVKVLTREIVPPIGLDEEITPTIRAAMLDMADRIRRSVPVYRLEFLPNRGFWELIDQEISN